MKRLLFVVLATVAVLYVLPGRARKPRPGDEIVAEPRPALAAFRLVRVDGRAVGGVSCARGVRGARMVLGGDRRWWVREEGCGPLGGEAIWVGAYRWSAGGDTLYLNTLAAWGQPERPKARGIVQGDTLRVAELYGGPEYAYVRTDGAAR